MTHDRDGGAAEFIAVPKEPTEAMCDAFFHAEQYGYPAHKVERQKQGRGWKMLPVFVWEAMLSVAPKQASDVRSKKWTDDDQSALNAAVYDAMWHWEDAPIDVDDAMSLASAFKAKLEENGLTIVAISGPEAQP